MYIRYHPRSIQANNFTIVVSTISTRVRINIMCPSGETFLTVVSEYNDWIIRVANLMHINEKRRSLPKTRLPFNIPRSNHRLHTKLIF
jgi:predicted ATPase